MKRVIALAVAFVLFAIASRGAAFALGGTIEGVTIELK
jgi:hypothetical protein